MQNVKLIVRFGDREVIINNCSDEDIAVKTLMSKASFVSAIITIEVSYSLEVAAVLGPLVFGPRAAQAHLIPVLSKRLCELDLSVRSEGILSRNGYTFIWEVVQWSESDFRKLKTMSPKTMAEINKKILQAFGLTWQMDLSQIKDQLPR